MKGKIDNRSVPVTAAPTSRMRSVCACVRAVVVVVVVTDSMNFITGHFFFIDSVCSFVLIHSKALLASACPCWCQGVEWKPGLKLQYSYI